MANDPVTDLESRPILDGRYRILHKIGEGGMGEVWVAEHVHLEKRVALKLLRPEILANREAVARFRQEARSASSIGHENIIQIDDFGTLPDGRVYMAMEWLQGQPLDAVLKAGPVPAARALELLIQTSKGLAAAHAKGITHRDMKPENVFVTQREERDVVKILDFGIAKVAGDAGAGKPQTLTIAGTIFGTPQYMAPEQAMGARVDHRVDVYAMGVILYEVFCGQVPFVAETFMGVLSQHITAAPPPPAEIAAANGRKLPAGMSAVILRALAKDPGQRYQTMPELVAALTEIYRQTVGPRASGQVATTTAPGSRWKTILLAVLSLGVVAVVVKILTASPTLPTAPPVPGPPIVVVSSPPPIDPIALAPTQPLVPAPVPVPPPLPAPVPAPVPAPIPGPIVRTQRVMISSSPAGAMVYAGSTRLGVTPLAVNVKEGEPRTVRLVLDGYREARFSVDGSKPAVSRLLIAEGLMGPEDP